MMQGGGGESAGEGVKIARRMTLSGPMMLL
jgi:hypothetical protein